MVDMQFSRQRMSGYCWCMDGFPDPGVAIEKGWKRSFPQRRRAVVSTKVPRCRWCFWSHRRWSNNSILTCHLLFSTFHRIVSSLLFSSYMIFVICSIKCMCWWCHSRMFFFLRVWWIIRCGDRCELLCSWYNTNDSWATVASLCMAFDRTNIVRENRMQSIFLSRIPNSFRKQHYAKKKLPIKY